ncbi:Protein of uncharacterised function (DUF2809) [Streptococcus pneumoniae]|nr:Protein of uncharacterised function (DUF2809) [Streptococcus pneumoniae]
MNTKRNRVVYALFTIVVIILGLSSRKFAFTLPHLLNDYLGDALWALMIFTGFGFLFPKTETKKLAFISLMFCYGIEASQLYKPLHHSTKKRIPTRVPPKSLHECYLSIPHDTIGVGVGILCEVIFRKK